MRHACLSSVQQPTPQVLQDLSCNVVLTCCRSRVHSNRHNDVQWCTLTQERDG